jgi:hypothetical protein
MRREEILQFLRERPFRPFRIHLTNGTVHEIRHPEMAVVTATSVIIGVAESDSPEPLLRDYVVVSLLHVAPAEPLPSPATSQSTGNQAGG